MQYISKSGFRPCLTGNSATYFTILLLGNIATTLTAGATSKNIVEPASAFDVLTINDWIVKARDNAVAAAIKAQADAEHERAQLLAQRLRAIPEDELNAHILMPNIGEKILHNIPIKVYIVHFYFIVNVELNA